RFMFPDKVMHAINTYACTTFAGVPTVYNILLSRSHLRAFPLPGLRRFLQAGGALAPERIRQMRDIVPTAEFLVMYGQTEATARISCLPPDRLGEKLGSAGLPLDNLVIRIVGETGVHNIIERVRRALPPPWTCASVNVVAELPETANGKIARFQLQIMQ